jgi:hypothetical protein
MAPGELIRTPRSGDSVPSVGTASTVVLVLALAALVVGLLLSRRGGGGGLA